MLLRFYCLLAILLVASAGQAAECLNIGVASGAISSAAISRITETLFARSGSCAVIISLPQSRLNQIETQGSLDGEALRVMSYLEQRPQLLAVPTPILHFSGNLYWPPGRPEPSGANAVIGGIAGQIWQRQAALQRQAEFREMASYDDMLLQTARGSLQGFLMAAEAFRHFSAAEPALSDYNRQTVTEIPFYLMINRRHKGLVPVLDKAVAELVASGYIDQQLNRISP